MFFHHSRGREWLLNSHQEGGVHNAKQANSSQQSHAKGMQHLEAEAIKKGKERLPLLPHCLQCSPPKTMGFWWPPSISSWGNAPLSTLLNIHPQYLLPNMSLPHWLLVLLLLWNLGPLPLPQPDCIPLNQEPPQEWPPREPSCLKRRDEMPLHKALTGGKQEAFARDSDLVQRARDAYYKTNCPHFDCKSLCNLMNVFPGDDQIHQSTRFANLQDPGALGRVEQTAIHQWCIESFVKGLQFFHAISPSEWPKVMGLTGIHNPRHSIVSMVWLFVPGVGRKDKMRGP